AELTLNLDYPLVDVNSAKAMEAFLTDLQREGYLTYRASLGRLVCSLTIAGWKNFEQSNTSASVEKPQGIHINISGGTIQGNIVGNVSGENAGVMYTSNTVPAREVPAPTPS